MIEPNEGPEYDITPGDICNVTKGDTCNKGVCIDSVCVSNNQRGAVCQSDKDCPVGSYCNSYSGGFCKATVPPGGACHRTAPGECGFIGVCFGSSCAIPYSLPLGDTDITSDYSQELASIFCESGYASAVNSPTGDYYCVRAPFTNPSQIGHGVNPGTQCQVVVNNADGSITSKTNVPKCGYNKDNLYYCPWALGDDPMQAMIAEARKYNFYEEVNKNCNPDMYGDRNNCKKWAELL